MSGIGKVAQLILAVVSPGNIVANIVAGGISEAGSFDRLISGAQQAGDMMQDLKTGHLLNASPRAQYMGMIIGSAFSVFVTVFSYQLFNSVYKIPGPNFEVPTAQVSFNFNFKVWLDMAELTNGKSLPMYSGTFSLIFSILFGFFTYVKAQGKFKKYSHFIPSGIAFAVGIYNPPYFTLPRVLGALVSQDRKSVV